MAHRVVQWLKGAGHALPEPDADLAIGALLVRIARADALYVFAEKEVIESILALRFDLTELQAREMRILCEQIDAEAPDTSRFAQLVRDSVPYQDRLAISLSMWEVVMADGVRRDEEIRIVSTIETVLGVLAGDLPLPKP